MASLQRIEVQLKSLTRYYSTMTKITRYPLALLIATASVIASVPSAQATIGIAGCSGIACNGQDPVSAGCLSGGVEIQDQMVANVGDIYLFESLTCGTAWARLNVSPTSMALVHGDLRQLAEIFYEPPTGGVEAFEATVWD